jgi:hypothetical protein
VDRQLPGGSVEVLQLSRLSAALIELCDGVRTVRDIATLFPRLGEDLDRFPPEQACRFALHELAQQGMLVFSPAAAAGFPDGVQPRNRPSTCPQAFQGSHGGL